MAFDQSSLWTTRRDPTARCFQPSKDSSGRACDVSRFSTGAVLARSASEADQCPREAVLHFRHPVATSNTKNAASNESIAIREACLVYSMCRIAAPSMVAPASDAARSRSGGAATGELAGLAFAKMRGICTCMLEMLRVSGGRRSNPRGRLIAEMFRVIGGRTARGAVAGGTLHSGFAASRVASEAAWSKSCCDLASEMLSISLRGDRCARGGTARTGGADRGGTDADCGTPRGAGKHAGTASDEGVVLGVAVKDVVSDRSKSSRWAEGSSRVTTAVGDSTWLSTVADIFGNTLSDLRRCGAAPYQSTFASEARSRPQT
mmetsp:Transcript_1929/g.5764  ORF Transcript_1929/g.5764 Transcript_1929/m.5764 type:complete len:319 (-) Transcript_1929:1248-2204(-)